jgi:hypothetical protein
VLGVGDIALNLPSPETLLYAPLVITALLIAIIVARPSIRVSTTGKMLAFVAFCVLPVLCGSMAASTHIERSKQTTARRYPSSTSPTTIANVASVGLVAIPGLEPGFEP